MKKNDIIGKKIIDYRGKKVGRVISKKKKVIIIEKSNIIGMRKIRFTISIDRLEKDVKDRIVLIPTNREYWRLPIEKAS